MAPRKSIGRRLSAIITSPLTSRSVAKPPWSSDEGDDGSRSSSRIDDDGGYATSRQSTTKTARSSNSKPSMFSMSKASSSKPSNKRRGKKVKKGTSRRGRGRRGRHHYSSESASYYSDEASLSPLSDVDESDSYYSKTSHTPSTSISSDHRHRHRGRRRRHHQQQHYHHSSSQRHKSSPVDKDDFLTREELHHFPAKKLRKRCRRAGIDASRMVDKADMVRALHDYYRRQSNSRHGGTVTAAIPTNIVELDEPTSQMVEILHEIVPFYGQGDDKSDAVVRDTIQRLPQHALDYPDAESGSTTLIFACQCGAEDLVEILISKGCDANARNSNGVAPLHCACYSDSFSPAIAKLLVDNGAVAEIIEDQFGCSPLHWAGYSGNFELCSLLCRAGANPRTVDNTSCDPIAYAEQSGNDECVQYLTSLAQSNANNASTTTPTRASLRSVDAAAAAVLSTTASKARKLAEVSASLPRVQEMPAAHDEAASTSKVVHVASREPPAAHDEAASTSKVVASRELPSSVEVPVSDSLAAAVGVLSPLPVDSSTGPRNDSTKPAAPTSTTLTNDTFEERLSALQSKMEEQFIQQLNKIEGRLTEQQNQQQAGQWTTSANGGTESGVATNESQSLAEMTSKVVQLQADIGSKDIEIVSLKRDISTLEAKLTKLESKGGRPSTSSKRMMRDAGVGECSILDGSSGNSVPHVGTDTESKTKKRIESDLDAKSKELACLQEQMADLEIQLGSAKQEIIAAQDKQALAERLMAASEEQLAKERVAKEDILRLLEQTKQGAQVGEEISRSIKEESAKDKETIARLELDLKSLEIVKTDEIAVLQSQIDHKEQKLVADGKQISLMMGEMDDMRQAVAS